MAIKLQTNRRCDIGLLRAMSFGNSMVPCGPGRANSIRLAADAWKPGDRPTALLELSAGPPKSIQVVITVRTVAGHLWRDERTVAVESEGAL